MNSRFVCALDSVYVQAAAEKAQKEQAAAAAAAPKPEAPKPEAPKPAAAAPPAPKPAAPAAKKADAEVGHVGVVMAVHRTAVDAVHCR